MANLWRAMALVWLGGLASPLLVDEPALYGAPLAGIQATDSRPDGHDVLSENDERDGAAAHDGGSDRPAG